MLEANVQQMLRFRAGAIEAPAGTGKTEQIALIAASVPGRWLVLTHTVAGVDAIRRRLAKHKVPADKAQVETLSAWAHRWARAFPNGSGLAGDWSARSREWDAVMVAATALVESGAVQSILSASYSGILVDEYQDCTVAHHGLVRALSRHLPCYVFGDPLQAIFGFRPGMLASWHTDTLATFPQAGVLHTPQRWIHAGNAALGVWLVGQRANFEAGIFDFRGAPSCLEWQPCAPKLAAQQLAGSCAIRPLDGETLAIIHTSVDEVRRADLAKAIYATTVEPIGGKTERNFYESLRTRSGIERVNAVLDLMGTAYVGVGASNKRKRVESLLANPTRIKTPATPAELALTAVAASDSFANVLDAIRCVENETGVTMARPELVSCIKSALQLCSENPTLQLDDAAFQVANARREKGRVLRNRAVGSTLLMKGLEFDHVVITPDACENRQHWYVALTRGTKSVRVLSPSVSFTV
ncbi:UvrD-helicase domain-containing protein [Burkholderia pseudomallei]|uniref:UvrD-helicase domain-containing protein n=1 Tax=Burkholderia pseudomallei TaxID=28450 RepID=UPI001AB00FF0|nr:UvrD-helicase domain-containing protein [Burkholderia pseudomallei]MBO2979800.1 UvrD-helicase domain-containing protein [Burkholderia pseudomallei]